MRLLLDTHVLLWAAGQPRRLPAAARRLLNDKRHQLYFSAASIWEVAIKQSLGRADFRAAPGLLRRGLLESGYTEMPINGEHGVAVNALAPLHRDPFDRILIAQALVESMLLVTADAQIAQYPGPVRKI